MTAILHGSLKIVNKYNAIDCSGGTGAVSIQDLGSIGELIAAVATIATLIYLALQIRANTKVTYAESRRGAMSQVNFYASILGENREAASIFRRGLAGNEPLDADEQTQFTFLFSMVVGQASTAFEEYELGITNRELFDATESAVIRLLKTPGGRGFWNSHVHSYPASFVAYVNALLEESDS